MMSGAPHAADNEESLFLSEIADRYAPVPNTVLKLRLPTAPRPAMRMGFGPGCWDIDASGPRSIDTLRAPPPRSRANSESAVKASLTLHGPMRPALVWAGSRKGQRMACIRVGDSPQAPRLGVAYSNGAAGDGTASARVARAKG